MTILVTGGAGYIGSHAVLTLKRQKKDVVIIDSLQTGHRGALDQDIPYYEGDLRDSEFLDHVFSAHKIDAVIHFAANSLVGESVTDPLKYYDNNVGGATSLLQAMNRHDVKKIVFSSTAATYGEPETDLIDENDPTIPTNPYGETKLAIEKMLKWAGGAYGLHSISLRYFNVAGADLDGEKGEDHNPETHLIPIVLQVALGQREKISVFGNDYPTPDGTCIRDYIHVQDLVDAHLLALEKLDKDPQTAVYNLGNGQGFSVMEVIEAARKVTGHDIPAAIEKRRAGDPAKLVASSARATKELGWKPNYPELERIIQTAWDWHRAHPEGYASTK
ncbi:UDP-glucose 4-epimerase GalE [Jeotgalibacillus proteolyticus]|uniref:UDP-glucose 4-epimerase n=1 Tax=Jeotgalibacillus proteolyticus TaxID=2082395 RepID=A0A2S5G9E9_9BACL|nr:UDP-glucose 4-epimerase GalE [Jeotgalibacillus proteolyticus]PPA69616.1 UDP-glucose 4-epimerase GalE [Jeotgalibacillus proteolyticus]